MLTSPEIKQRLGQVFEERQAAALAEVFADAYGALVTVGDFSELKAIVKELAEAQKRTEQRVEELAEAQKRTEEALQRLAQEHVETRRQLGGLAMTVGYTLGNEAFRALPELLHRDFGVVVRGRLKRQYVTDSEGGAIEVNIIGEASGEGQEVVIVGEAKSQLSRNDVDDFQRKKLNRLEGVFKKVFPVLVTHMITGPDVETYVKQKGMVLYYSYDF